MRHYIFGIVLFILISYSCVTPCTADPIRVAVAANMQFAFDEMKAKYEEKTGVDIQAVVGSSGKLMVQIKNGAPYHIFISADMKYPDLLYKEGWSLTEPEVYGYGSLVLWSFTDISSDQLLNSLTSTKVKKIALADPITAPYGLAAIATLKKSGIYEHIKAKLIFGQSVSQVNQYVASRGADIGFTAKSVVLASKLRNKGSWSEVDQTLYDAIAQGVVVLKYAKGNRLVEAQNFYRFLFSKEAQQVLERYGYRIE